MAAKRAKTPKRAETPATTPVAPLVVQPHGGALRVGNPGNKGGRPSDEFKAMMARMVSRERTIAALGMILKRPDHPHWPAAFKLASQKAYPELEPMLMAAKMKAEAAAPNNLTINFNIVQEGERYVADKKLAKAIDG